MTRNIYVHARLHSWSSLEIVQGHIYGVNKEKIRSGPGAGFLQAFDSRQDAFDYGVPDEEIMVMEVEI